jgi:hypothetical protein
MIFTTTTTTTLYSTSTVSIVGSCTGGGHNARVMSSGFSRQRDTSQNPSTGKKGVIGAHSASLSKGHNEYVLKNGGHNQYSPLNKDITSMSLFSLTRSVPGGLIISR